MSVLLVPETTSLGSHTQTKSFFESAHSTATQEDAGLEERAASLLVCDLIRLGWRLRTGSPSSLELVPPPHYEKSVVRAAMAHARNETIDANSTWIDAHLQLARDNLASGRDALRSEVRPRIEICKSQRQNDLFRMFRYYWSSPSSEYVGRRMRLLVRDDGLPDSPVIGIAAIGSSIIHIPARDKWIGWDITTRTDRIIYMMDAYVIGALPPYNELLGGKLVSYLLTSNELRKLYADKYVSKETLIRHRSASDLAMIMTTGLYGSSSSQYNRLKYGRSLLYKLIGSTSGYGSLHISSQTFSAMRALVAQKGLIIPNRFGDGPNWRMRVIRSACDILGFDSDVILKHSFQRGLYAIPLATNFRAFLKAASATPRYRNLPLDELAAHWRSRWLNMRKENAEVIRRVREFSPEKFSIAKSLLPPLE